MRQAGIGAGIAVWTLAGLVAAGVSLAAGCTSQHKTKSQVCEPATARCTKPLVVFAPPVVPELMDTPSSDYVNHTNVQPALAQRNWEPMASYYAPPAVEHGPLYFEDPFEDKDKVSGGGYAGWTWEDYLSIPYSDARWLLNTVALPVSVVVTPPWTRMCSDGQISKQRIWRDHDAAPCIQRVPVPFDLQCPDAQAVALTQLSGGPLPVTAPEPAPASVPSTQPLQ